jgi:hypothetical protein
MLKYNIRNEYQESYPAGKADILTAICEPIL